MAVPKFYFFIEPVLRILANAGAPVRRRDILERAPHHLDLSDVDMATMAGKGRLTQVEDRTGWALSYASMSGLAESPTRGMWTITPAGKAELEQHPEGIPLERLHDIRRGARTGDLAESEGLPADEALAPVELESIDDGSGETPDERLRAAYAEIHSSIANELLSLVRNAEPAFFEALVLDLLHAMGYGTSRDDLRQTGAGADGGIDGVITLDKLGLEKVYVQAKRYAEGHNVGRPAIQAFLGALAGRRATKGVFITTSSFSKEAQDFARSASDSLVLVGGQRLAALMIEHHVGVSVKETITLVSIDSDYFEALD